jgi:hypothetical protein
MSWSRFLKKHVKSEDESELKKAEKRKNKGEERGRVEEGSKKRKSGERGLGG